MIRSVPFHGYVVVLLLILASLSVFSVQTVTAQGSPPINVGYPSNLTFEQCPFPDCGTCTLKSAQVSLEYPGSLQYPLRKPFEPHAEKIGSWTRVFWDFEELHCAESHGEIWAGTTKIVDYIPNVSSRLGVFYADSSGTTHYEVRNEGACYDDRIKEMRVWWFENCDSELPAITLGPTSGPGFFQLTVQDTGSGLQTLAPIYDPAKAIVTYNFTPRTQDPVIVTVVRKDASSADYGVTLTATDMVNNSKRFEFRPIDRCSSIVGATIPSVHGNILWAGITAPGEVDWNVVEPNATGRMFLSLEPTERAPYKDYDLEVWSDDCQTLLAKSQMTVGNKPIGERLLLNVQPNEKYRTRIYGKTASDFLKDPEDKAGYFEAVSYGNFNRLLSAGRATLSPVGPPEAGAPAGVLVITVPFTNISNYELRDLTFEVNVLSGGNGVLNADGPRTGDGSVLVSISNIDLPPNQYSPVLFVPGLDPGESFNVTFRIGLQSRNGFSLWTDVFGTRFVGANVVNPAAVEANDSSESFKFEFAEADLMAKEWPVYLPVIQR